MPAKNPRITAVLEKPLYDLLLKKAKKEGVSISIETRDLLRQALSDYEEAFWAREGVLRAKTMDRKKLVPHKEFWKRAGL